MTSVNGQCISSLQNNYPARSEPNQGLIKCPVADFLLKGITLAFMVIAEWLPTSLHMNGPGATSIKENAKRISQTMISSPGFDTKESARGNDSITNRYTENLFNSAVWILDSIIKCTTVQYF